MMNKSEFTNAQDFSRLINVFGLLFLALLAFVALSARVASAVQPVNSGSMIHVNTTADELNADGDCSLREAVRSANLNSIVDACAVGSGTDMINIPAGTYTLSIGGSGEEAALTGDLDLADDVIIQGSGSAVTIIDGGGIDRVFHVQPGIEAEFNALSIVGGLETPLGGGGLQADFDSRVQVNESLIANNSSGSGGGIVNGGTMTLTFTTISTNTATINSGGGIVTSAGGSTTLISSTLHFNKGVAGGGLSTFDGAITFIDSTVSDNEDTSALSGGGGIRIAGSNAVLNVVNSTISGNSSPFTGGGIYALSGGVVYLVSATVANNSTGGSGGGLNGDSGNVTMWNSILGDNSGSVNPDCSSIINSAGYNLIEIHSPNCIISGVSTGVITGVDPALGPLQNNGGPTFTQALLGSSPAIEAGNPLGCNDIQGQPLTADQRGFPRPFDATCDIGAFEAQAAANGGKVYLPAILNP
jgi:CSLREA domain-containing protein